MHRPVSSGTTAGSSSTSRATAGSTSTSSTWARRAVYLYVPKVEYVLVQSHAADRFKKNCIIPPLHLMFFSATLLIMVKVAPTATVTALRILRLLRISEPKLLLSEVASALFHVAFATLVLPVSCCLLFTDGAHQYANPRIRYALHGHEFCHYNRNAQAGGV